MPKIVLANVFCCWGGSLGTYQAPDIFLKQFIPAIKENTCPDIIDLLDFESPKIV